MRPYHARHQITDNGNRARKKAEQSHDNAQDPEKVGFNWPAAACLAVRAALRIAKLTAYAPEEALESAVEAAVDAAVEAAARVVASPSGAGFWQLTFAFVCGGLFFATVTATAGAVYAFGLDNVKRGLRLFGLLWRRVNNSPAFQLA